jgi:hypothetical protein
MNSPLNWVCEYRFKLSGVFEVTRLEFLPTSRNPGYLQMQHRVRRRRTRRAVSADTVNLFSRDAMAKSYTQFLFPPGFQP